MSDTGQQFVAHLIGLRETNGEALAQLRRSLAFAPGAYAPAYPHVERFVAADAPARDPQRLALYVIAGLFALQPRTAPDTLAGSLGELMRRRDSVGIEKHFLALLGADAENLPGCLRQAVGLLATEDIGLDYGALFDDLGLWLGPDPGVRERIRQRWARDFYRSLSRAAEPPRGLSKRMS